MSILFLKPVKGVRKINQLYASPYANSWKLFNEIWLRALRIEFALKGVCKVLFSPLKFCVRSTLHKDQTEFNLHNLGLSQRS
jgi:hypothetical protein